MAWTDTLTDPNANATPVRVAPNTQPNTAAPNIQAAPPSGTNQPAVAGMNPPASPGNGANALPVPAMANPSDKPGAFTHALFHALVGGTLGTIARGSGGNNYTVDSDPNSPTYGQTIASLIPETPGSRARDIVRGALVGLAAASQERDKGSGAANALAGAGAGFQAANVQAQAEEAERRARAQENFRVQQQALTTKSQIALTNVNNYRNFLDAQKLGDEQSGLTQQMNDNSATVDELEKAGIPIQIVDANTIMPTAKTDPHHLSDGAFLPVRYEPLTGDNNVPVLDAQGHPQRRLMVAIIPGGHKDPENGNITFSAPAGLVDDIHRYVGDFKGIQSAKSIQAGDPMTKTELLNYLATISKARAEETAGLLKPELSGVDDKGNAMLRNPGVPVGVKGDVFIAPPETQPQYKAQWATQQAALKLKQAEVAQKLSLGNSEDALATWRTAQAAATKANANAGKADVFGNKSTLDMKEFNKRYDSFSNSPTMRTLSTLQGSYQQFQSALADINSGKDLTGAESVTSLFNAIGISATPLAGKGFRINSNTIEEHVDARGMDQAAYQKLLKLKSGAVITSQQIRDYAKIATGVYAQSYINAATEERRQLNYMDVVPQGHNSPIDPTTARIFHTLADGDENKAMAAAAASGWILPKGQ